MTGEHLHEIPVSAMDLSDTGFRITGTDQNLDNLTRSISENGILLPPLVLEKEGAFIVVSGFRRITAAQKSGINLIPCRVWSTKDNNPVFKKAAMASVAENAFTRELTPSEQVRSVALLTRFMDAGEVARRSPLIFNAPLNKGYITALSRIHQMSGKTLELLDLNHLSIKACKMLMVMPRSDIQDFLELFSQIKISSGNQIQVIAWAKEICACEKIRLTQLFEQSPIGPSGAAEKGTPLPSHKDLSALGKQFKAFLAAKRFPVLTQAKTKAAEQIRHLNLDKGMQLTIPENFEGLDFAMHLEFKTVQEFKTHLERLLKIADDPDFTALVDR